MVTYSRHIPIILHHDILVQGSLPWIQQTPFPLSEVHGHLLERHRPLKEENHFLRTNVPGKREDISLPWLMTGKEAARSGREHPRLSQALSVRMFSDQLALRLRKAAARQGRWNLAKRGALIRWRRSHKWVVLSLSQISVYYF